MSDLNNNQEIMVHLLREQGNTMLAFNCKGSRMLFPVASCLISSSRLGVVVASNDELFKNVTDLRLMTPAKGLLWIQGGLHSDSNSKDEEHA